MLSCRSVLLAATGLVLVAAVPAAAQTVDEARQSQANGPSQAGSATAAAGPAEQQDAASEDQLRDIIVTAQKTESTVQRTPIAISVVSGDAIAEQARTSADDVLKNLPGVEVQGAARGLVIAIRGLGSDLPPGVGESSVSTNFDGVYNIRAEAGVLGFYDLDRVEVLRGPQSTLYGRNATGGVVNVISAVPEIGNYGGYVSLNAGNYDLMHAEGAANIPLGDTAALRVAATAITRDGYLSNGHNDQVGQGARAKLVVKPGSDVTALFGFESAHIAGHGPGAVEAANVRAGNYYTTADPAVGGQDYKSYKYWFQGDVKIGPGTLTVLPAYQTGSGTVYGFFGGRGTDGNDPRRVRQKSVEARYASNPGSPVTWLVGYYHYDYLQYTTSTGLDYNAATGAITRGSFGYTRNTGNSDAAFGQATLPLGARFRLIAGGRYTWDKRGATGTGFAPGSIYQGQVDGNFFDYRAGAELDLAPASLVYFTAASAFRPGGINPFSGGSFRPERLHSYEIGSKNRFLGNRLQLNASGFYYDYSDFQVVDFFIGPTGPSLVFYNADATNYGAELEAQALLSRADQVNVSIAYLHSKIDSDLILHPNDPFTNVNFRGERLPHSPEWSIKAGYQHVLEVGDGDTLTPRGDIRYVSRQFVAPNNSADATQPGYVTGDLTLSYANAATGLTLTGYVKNVDQQKIKTGYFVGYLTTGAPRTYGATLTARF